MYDFLVKILSFIYRESVVMFIGPNRLIPKVVPELMFNPVTGDPVTSRQCNGLDYVASIIQDAVDLTIKFELDTRR